MRHGRGRRAAVAGGLVVCALGLSIAPVSADPGTVPTMTAPAGVQPVSVSGPVTASASSEAPVVQFYVDDSTPLGGPVTGGSPGNPAIASAGWSSWSFPNGAHTLTAADCDSGTPACNATRATPIAVTLSNTMPSISQPSVGAVWGDVQITASADAPRVQFFAGATPIGSPVDVQNGTASVSWSTWSLPNGP